MYAQTQRQRLPRMDRNGINATNPTRIDHISWINRTIYNHYRESLGLDLKTFLCPNRGADYIKTQGPQGGQIRITYYTMFGRDESIWTYAPYPVWPSPQVISDPGAWVMAADLIESGTVTPPISSGSHGAVGVVEGPQLANPIDIGSEGGNQSFLDGSVTWKNQAEMVEYAASSGSGIRGYW
jgi:hypothetical protein